MITVKTSPHWQHCLNTVARPNRVATDAESATFVFVSLGYILLKMSAGQEYSLGLLSQRKAMVSLNDCRSIPIDPRIWGASGHPATLLCMHSTKVILLLQE